MYQKQGLEFRIASINFRIRSSSSRTRARKNGERETAKRPLMSSAKRGMITKCGTTSFGRSRVFGSRDRVGSHQALPERDDAERPSKRLRCLCRYAQVFGKSSRSFFSVNLEPSRNWKKRL